MDSGLIWTFAGPFSTVGVQGRYPPVLKPGFTRTFCLHSGMGEALLDAAAEVVDETSVEDISDDVDEASMLDVEDASDKVWLVLDAVVESVADDVEDGTSVEETTVEDDSVEDDSVEEISTADVVDETTSAVLDCVSDKLDDWALVAVYELDFVLDTVFVGLAELVLDLVELILDFVELNFDLVELDLLVDTFVLDGLTDDRRVVVPLQLPNCD